MNIERLLHATKQIVPQKIISNWANPEKISPTEIEKISLTALEEAIPSVLSGAKAILIGGQRFPDITIGLDNETQGVEVKSTRSASNPWTVTGGSIMEGNRIENVNDVWVMFTRLAGEVETKTRPYADAIKDIAVTHSPRYILDMDIPKGKGLFANLPVTYEDVRTSNSPFDHFRNYLAEKAKKAGGHPWWTETESEVTAPPLIRFWGDLKESEKNNLLVEGYALFAGELLLGSKKTKYNGFAMHLLRNHSVICKSIRDPFSAGGKKIIFKDLEEVPAVFKRFFEMRGDIKNVITTSGRNHLSSWTDWKKNLLKLAAIKKSAVLERIIKEFP